MADPALVPSDRILELSQSLDTEMQMFVRDATGLHRTGCTCRILDLGRSRARQLIVETPTHGTAPYPVHAGEQIEFFFEIDGVGYAFGTRVIERSRFALNPTNTIPALRLEYPPDLLKIQRRAYYRASASPETPISVRIRPVDPAASDEERAFATGYPYEARILDISGAGVGLIFDGDPPFEPRLDQVLTVAFRLAPEDTNDIVLDARVRVITRADDKTSTILGLAWVDCTEDDEVTGPFAERIFRYVAERQRVLSQARSERLRRRR